MNADINDLKLELWLRRRNSGELVWTTKANTKIPIKEMSTSHVINAINMLEWQSELEDVYLDNLDIIG